MYNILKAYWQVRGILIEYMKLHLIYDIYIRNGCKNIMFTIIPRTDRNTMYSFSLSFPLKLVFHSFGVTALWVTHDKALYKYLLLLLIYSVEQKKKLSRNSEIIAVEFRENLE